VSELRVSELQRIGAGREAEIFALENGRALRLARGDAFREAVAREHFALLAARRCGAPVPDVYELLDVEGRPGLVLERLEGHDLLVELLRRPWRAPALPAILASLHVLLHETPAPAELPDLVARTAERLRSALVPLALRDPALRALERLPHGERLCHGDFHPGNVFRRRSGDFALLDWKAAARGDPAGDVAATRLLLLDAWIPGGASRVQRLLAPLRRALYQAYLRSYRRRRTLTSASVEAWVPVLAAARLSDEIPEERAHLLALARRGLRAGRSRPAQKSGS
jgi:aminoglycoside phosphotransferase (APT) family kinase protein